MENKSHIFNKILNPIKENHEQIGYKKSPSEKEARDDFHSSFSSFDAERFTHLKGKENLSESEQEEFHSLDKQKENIEQHLNEANRSSNKKEEKVRKQEVPPEKRVEKESEPQEKNLVPTQEKEGRKPFLSKERFSQFSKRLSSLKEHIPEPVRKSYTQYTTWLNTGSTQQKLAKRALVGGVIGLTVGTLSGAGISVITGAVAIKAARSGVSFLAGTVASGAYNRHIEKKQQRRKDDIQNVKKTYHEDVEKTQGVSDKGSISFRNRNAYTALKEKREQGTLNEQEKKHLSLIEGARRDTAEQLLGMRKKYQERNSRMEERFEKTERTRNRNTMLVGAAAGLLSGFTFQWSSLEIPAGNHSPLPSTSPEIPNVSEPSISPEVPEVVEIPEVPQEKAVDLSEIYIQKGEGVTHAFMRQIESHPELQEHFGLKEGYTKDELVGAAAEAARETGYLSDGSEVRVFYGEGAGYELLLDDGQLKVVEYEDIEYDKESKTYTPGTSQEVHVEDTPSAVFEGEAIEKHREYLYQGGISETTNTADVTHTHEEYPTDTREAPSSAENYTHILGKEKLREYGMGSALSQAKLPESLGGIKIPQKIIDLFQLNKDYPIRIDTPQEAQLVFDAMGIVRDPELYDRSSFLIKETGEKLNWSDIYERVNLRTLKNSVEILRQLRHGGSLASWK